MASFSGTPTGIQMRVSIYVRYSDNETLDQELNNIPAHTDAYSNGYKCYGSVPDSIDTSETWWIKGGNMNGLRPFGDMASLITVAERL
jgi:hypothetical protein